MIERRREAGIAVAAGHDFRFRPDLEADLPERAPIFVCCATGKENSRAIDLLRQFGKNRAQTSGVVSRKFDGGSFPCSRMRNSAAGSFGYSFNQYPGGFRSAAFHPEDALTGFHDSLCITVLPGNLKAQLRNAHVGCRSWADQAARIARSATRSHNCEPKLACKRLPVLHFGCTSVRLPSFRVFVS